MKELDWANLPFGYMKTDYNVRIYYRNEQWGALEVCSEETIPMHMAATCRCISFPWHPDRTRRHSPNRALSYWRASWLRNCRPPCRHLCPKVRHGRIRG